MKHSTLPLVLLILVGNSASCSNDSNSSGSSNGDASSSTAGTSTTGSTGDGGLATGGTSGGVGIACPPGIPLANQSVGGGTSAGVVCNNGQGAVKFGERCLISADCVSGTFCYSSQCTAICGGDARHALGVVSTKATCSALFGFAECGARVQQQPAENSIFFCAPTCAKDADCSVGEKCNEVTNYTNMPNGSQQWYTVGTVCTVN